MGGFGRRVWEAAEPRGGVALPARIPRKRLVTHGLTD